MSKASPILCRYTGRVLLVPSVLIRLALAPPASYIPEKAATGSAARGVSVLRARIKTA